MEIYKVVSGGPKVRGRGTHYLWSNRCKSEEEPYDWSLSVSSSSQGQDLSYRLDYINRDNWPFIYIHSESYFEYYENGKRTRKHLDGKRHTTDSTIFSLSKFAHPINKFLVTFSPEDVEAPAQREKAQTVPTIIDPSLTLSTVCDNYEKLFLSATDSDVIFEIGDEAIPAHKAILTAQVPFFEKMFASGMRESRSNLIKIEDADAESFKRVVKFIYCGKLPENFENSAEIFLPMADKYNIENLKELCASVLTSRLTKDNVIDTLILADLYCCPDLKRACLVSLEKLKLSFDLSSLESLKPYPELLIEIVSFQLQKSVIFE